MSLADFIEKSKYRYKKQGMPVLPKIGYDFVTSAMAKTPYITRYGRNIFDHDWDVLLVLDATRWDMYQDVIGEGERVWSAGASSPEWMKNQFRHPETENTAYVTANHFSEKHADGKFEFLDEVWKYKWDENLGTVPPKSVMDRVIDVARNRDHDRVIGHFMQPHYPFIDQEEDLRFGQMDDADWKDGRKTSLSPWMEMFYDNSTYDIAELRDAYWRNLENVFEYVEIILENVDGDVVITADHGNAMGEFGLWGHKVGLLHPQMRWVPWDERTGTDTETYDPEINPRNEDEDYDLEEQLEQLGYVQ